MKYLIGALLLAALPARAQTVPAPTPCACFGAPVPCPPPGSTLFCDAPPSNTPTARPTVDAVTATMTPTPIPHRATSTPTVFALDCVDEAGFVVCPPHDLHCECVCWSDVNRDGEITVDEIVTAITNAVNGCPRAPAGDAPLTCWGSATYWNIGVTVADLLIVTDEALNGCPFDGGPEPFDPTPTPMPECASFTPVFHWIECPTATSTLAVGPTPTPYCMRCVTDYCAIISCDGDVCPCDGPQCFCHEGTPTFTPSPVPSMVGRKMVP